MKKYTQYPRSVTTISIIALSVFLITTCMNKDSENNLVIKNLQGESFAGSETCISCHKSVYENHLKTAHYHTSRKATEEYIKGSFKEGENRYAYNASVVVAMEKRDSGFYQVEYFRDLEKKVRRFDVVVGSGTKGQSFLYWRDNKLFQLPITFFTAADQWSNSPGFPDKVVFNRVITSRCLECHTSFAKTISAPGKEPEEFDNAQMIFGVDCEKCHGPAAKHVEFQSQHPKETKSKYIINPVSFSRQQNLDLCASCHGAGFKNCNLHFHLRPAMIFLNFLLLIPLHPSRKI
jgi:nitrate/TMAO reductase-like tetraheme cytochrome c subunit